MKISLAVMTTGLLLACVIAVIIVVGSIFMSDESRQDARIDQPSTPSLADESPERNRL
jgi:hypothetical protein